MSIIRFASRLRNVQLTDDQLKAIEAIVSPYPASMAFRGPAGCGKTTVLQHAAKRLPLDQTIFIAPTNKALEVFSSKLPNGARCKTLAKAIGKVSVTVDGEEKFVIKEKLRDRLFKEYEEDCICYFIVDESSMIGQEDADLLDEMVERCDAKIVWAGDVYQLPPVKDSPCKQFYDPEVSFELTKVLRHGGAVLSYATHIRSQFSLRHSFPVSDCLSSDSSIYLKSKQDWFDSFCSSLSCRDLSSRALCWTNANVSALTKKSRIAVYGDRSKNGWLPGEVLMIHGRHISPDGVILYTSFEYEVLGNEIEHLAFDKGILRYITPKTKEEKALPLCVSGDFQVLTAVRVFFDGTRAAHQVKIYCPTPNSEAKLHFQHIKKSMANFKQKNYLIDEQEKEDAYAKIASINSYFAPLRSAQVMTVHKSQGSTFENVYIFNDLVACENPERNNLLYVASTRASKSAIFSTFA